MDYFGNSRARYLKTLDAIPEDIAVNKAAKILDIGGYSVFEDMMIDRYGFENLKTFKPLDLASVIAESFISRPYLSILLLKF